MSESQFIVRTKIRFHRVAHPEVVAFLEALEPGAMATVLSALIVRGVLEVTGRTRARLPDLSQASAPQWVTASEAISPGLAGESAVQACPGLGPPPPSSAAKSVAMSQVPPGVSVSGEKDKSTAAETSRRLSVRLGLSKLVVDPFDYGS